MEVGNQSIYDLKLKAGVNKKIRAALLGFNPTTESSSLQGADDSGTNCDYPTSFTLCFVNGFGRLG